ncbi:MAG: thiamine ABC transporter substrate-binding protein [Nitriliruptoraceae bacterium]
MKLHPLTIALVALLVSACGGDQASDSTPDASPDTPSSGVTLTLLTHDSFDVSSHVLESFTTSTDITVEVVPLGDAGTLVNQAILTRDNPQGDVLFGVDNTFLSRALDADLFLEHRSPRLDVVNETYQLDPGNRVTPIDVGDVCLNHDRVWFDEHGLEVPTDLADLTDPAYRGLLVVQNPATSSPGLAFLLATVERFGEDGWLDFWAQLRDNDVIVTDDWSQAYYGEFTWAGGGDRPLVVSYASSPPAEVYFADPQPDEAPTGVIEASCFRQIEFAGVLAGTDHPEEAGLLIDHLLSVEFQEDLPLTMFVFPVVDDAALPDVFAQHAVVIDDPLQVDPSVIGEHRDAWIDAWTTTVLR